VQGQTLGTIEVVEEIQAKAAPSVVAPIAPILSTRHSATGGVRGQTLETIETVEAIRAKATPPAVAMIAPTLPTRHSATGGVRGQTPGTIAAVRAEALLLAVVLATSILPTCLLAAGVSVLRRDRLSGSDRDGAPGIAERQHSVRDRLPVFAGSKSTSVGACVQTRLASPRSSLWTTCCKSGRPSKLNEELLGA
jgi:hypothetical protein